MGRVADDLPPGEAEAMDDAIPGWREMTLEQFRAAKLVWADGQLDLMNALEGR